MTFSSQTGEIVQQVLDAKPEFQCLGQREPVPTSCLLSSTHTLLHMHTHIHTKHQSSLPVILCVDKPSLFYLPGSFSKQASPRPFSFQHTQKDGLMGRGMDKQADMINQPECSIRFEPGWLCMLLQFSNFVLGLRLLMIRHWGKTTIQGHIE